MPGIRSSSPSWKKEERTLNKVSKTDRVSAAFWNTLLTPLRLFVSWFCGSFWFGSEDESLRPIFVFYTVYRRGSLLHVLVKTLFQTQYQICETFIELMNEKTAISLQSSTQTRSSLKTTISNVTLVTSQIWTRLTRLKQLFKTQRQIH